MGRRRPAQTYALLLCRGRDASGRSFRERRLGTIQFKVGEACHLTAASAMRMMCRLNRAASSRQRQHGMAGTFQKCESAVCNHTEPRFDVSSRPSVSRPCLCTACFVLGQSRAVPFISDSPGHSEVGPLVSPSP